MPSRVRNKQVELRVRIKNKRTCCICHDPNKEIMLHHIDGNPENTVESNLAVLCLPHASEADAGLKKGKLGAGGKLTPEEVRAFKKQWEAKVGEEVKVTKRVISLQERRQLRILYKFEINRVKHEILSLYLSPSRGTKRLITQKLGFLIDLSIYEEMMSGLKLRREAINALSDIASFPAWEDGLYSVLTRAILDLHLHLIGPLDVPIDAEDKRILMQSLDVLDTLGSYAAWLTDSERPLKKTLATIAEIAGISSLYKFRDPVKKSLKVLNKMRKEVGNYAPEVKKETAEKRRKHRIKLIDEALAEVKTLLE